MTRLTHWSTLLIRVVDGNGREYKVVYSVQFMMRKQKMKRKGLETTQNNIRTCHKTATLRQRC
jgi:hypothetical protein